MNMILTNKLNSINRNIITFIALLSCLLPDVHAQNMVLESKQVSNSPISSSILVNNNNTKAIENKKTKENASNKITEIEAEKVIVVSKTAPLGVDIYSLPFYGEYEKTEAQSVIDQLFVADCEKQFESKKAASEFFSKMAWQYLEEGDKKTALNRFNYAWLLDKTNLEAYWGQGVIAFQNSSYQNAIKWISEANTLSNEQNHVLMVDLATVYIKTAFDNPNSMIEIAEAKKILNKVIILQPEFNTTYSQLALCNVYENQIDEAWENFHKAFELNNTEFNQELLIELLKKKPDPKGLFK